MIIRYKHTQAGTALFLVFGIALLILLVLYTFTKQPIPLIIIVPILLIGAFISLTIEIREHLLCWRFGVGLIRKQVKLADIRRIEIVKNPWWYGVGIHHTPRGWLYNVSGLRGVEITLKNGKRFRLGTNEPDALTRAIKDAISSVLV